MEELVARGIDYPGNVGFLPGLCDMKGKMEKYIQLAFRAFRGLDRYACSIVNLLPSRLLNGECTIYSFLFYPV